MGLLRALGPGRIVALGAVALMLLGFFAFVTWRVSAPDYTLLFSGLQLSDSQRLVQRLEELGVPYRLSGSGDAIMVPEDRVLRLRMSLAEEGMPLGNTTGYELLDRAGPFGTSEFQAAVNLQRALEGELARSIATLREIRSARVHINLPKRELFTKDAAPPTASIVISLRGGTALEKQQVAGIKHLVAAAVSGLTAEHITLVDDSGNLLAEPLAPGSDGFGAGDAEDFRAAYEARLKSKIVQLLERTLGPGHVVAEVSADMDFDEVATTAESYDPNGQVVRSTQTTAEKSDTAERKPDDAVTVANNLPTERNQNPASLTSSERNNRTGETVNYEISRVVRNQTHRGGSLKRLSIAVQIDGNYKPQPDGSQAFEPRSADELKELTALVRGAAGLDDQRGDHLEIVSRRFVQPESGEEPGTSLLGLEREDYWRIGQLATFAVLTLLILFLAVLPTLRRVFPPAPAPAAVPRLLGPDGQPLPAQGTPLLTDASGQPLLGQDGAASQLEGAGGRLLPALGDGSAMVDLQQVKGQVRASLVESVAGFVEEHPDEAVRVVRTWLHGR